MYKLNAKLINYYNQIVTPSGLRLSNTQMTYSGQINDYDFCMNIINPQTPYLFTLITNAFSNTPLSPEECNAFVRNFPSLVSFKINQTKITLSFKKMNEQTGAMEFRTILNGLLGLLKSHGYLPCCEACFRNLPTRDFAFANGIHKQLCEECSSNAANTLLVKQAEHKMTKENIPLGILGSFLGTLAGMLIIFLIARLGFVSIIGGLAMGFCSIYGYRLLSKKVSVVGIISSVVFMILGVYFITKFNWVYEFNSKLKDFGYTISKCWKDFDYLLKLGGGTSDFYVELFKFYLYTGIGSICAIVGYVGSFKARHDMFLVGGPYVNQQLLTPTTFNQAPQYTNQPMQPTANSNPFITPSLANEAPSEATSAAQAANEPPVQESVYLPKPEENVYFGSENKNQ